MYVNFNFDFFFLAIDSTKILKTLSNSRKSSPSRTPVKKQTKVPSLLDPSRLKPPPTQITSSGGNNTTSTGTSNLLGTNSRINYGLGIQSQQHDAHLTTSTTIHSSQTNDQEPQQQSPPRNITLHLDANEIITVTPDSSVI